MTYREASPPHEVVIPPLPVRFVHIVPAILFTMIGLLVGGFALAAVTATPKVFLVRCSTAADDVVTCELLEDGVVIQRGSAPRAQVESKSSGGHHPQRCMKVGTSFFSCGTRADDVAARARALEPGATVESDNSPTRSFISLTVGGLFSLMLFGLALPHLLGAMRRRRGGRIRVTPDAVEALAANGRVKRRVPRIAGELVRVANLPKGRGGPATACIVYGDDKTETPMIEMSTREGVVELAPAIDALRAALERIPRS
jgi:hypothetical protein